MAKKLGVGQDAISRVEQRTDMLLSTLGDYVRGMGGELALVAEFPDRPPVRLRGLEPISQTSVPKERKPKPARANPRAKAPQGGLTLTEVAADLEFAAIRDEIRRLQETDLIIADDPFARQEEVEQRLAEGSKGRITKSEGTVSTLLSKPKRSWRPRR